MKWLICKCKKSGELLVMNRKAREIFLSCCDREGMIVPSMVLKTFDNLEAVEKYFEEIRKVDLVIENVLKN